MKTEEIAKESAGNVGGTAPPHRREESPTGRGARGIVATGSVFGALGAASCCIAPLVLFSLGAGGAWIGNLTSLAPYQPFFVVVALSFLVAGFWMAYRRPGTPIPEGATCPRTPMAPWFKTTLWAATLVTLAAMAFPYAAPRLLDI